MSNHLSKVLLVGAGWMAETYATALQALNISFDVIGRGEESAAKFEAAFGVKVFRGGIDNFLTENLDAEKYSHAIVCVGVEELASASTQLIECGIKNILVEKPGGLNSNEITNLNESAKKSNTNIFIAYNRRFYSSVLEAQKIIEADGGVTSFHFEFTEWSHEIVDLKKADGVKENWFLANSSHVTDLAFFLGGLPKEMSAYKGGSIDWHPSASVFAGAGISESNALFSYHANWEAPGRWSVEILTKKHRLIFRPMEQLHIQEIGSVAITKVEVNDNLDKKFKPGIYLQTKYFLEGKTEKFCSLREQTDTLKWYQQISGYKN